MAFSSYAPSHEQISQMATQHLKTDEGTQIKPLINPDTGRPDGALVESLIERVAVFGRNKETLSIADVSYFKRALAKNQARRGYVYVQEGMAIEKSVMLLATLSHIRIVRLDVAASEL